MLNLRHVLVWIPTFLGLHASAQVSSPLRRTEFQLTAVEDSGTYFVYRYRVTNDRASSGGAAVVTLDMSGPRGAGLATFPSTGRFTDGPAVPGVRGASDHVPLGPISPQNWEAFLNKNATLDWYGAHSGFEGDIDSIAPGDTLEGFGVRSSYLPGLRRSWAAPTFRSCCTKARAGTERSEPEDPNPKEYRVAAWTVGPTVDRGHLTLSTLQADLQQICGSLGWIPDRAVCDGLRSLLQDAASAMERQGAQRARQALTSFLQELDNQHGPKKPVNSNAYWLLKINGDYLLAHL